MHHPDVAIRHCPARLGLILRQGVGCVLIASAGLAAAACSASPRDEYLQIRGLQLQGAVGDNSPLTLAPRLEDTALTGLDERTADAAGYDSLPAIR